MAIVVPYGTGNSRVACSETGSPSSVQLKMTHSGHEKPRTENRTEVTENRTEVTEPIGFGS
jgi:hypothetical protein